VLRAPAAELRPDGGLGTGSRGNHRGGSGAYGRRGPHVYCRLVHAACAM